MYAAITISDQTGTMVYPPAPTTPDTGNVYEVVPWGVAYVRYQVPPAGLGYEPVHVEPYPADDAAPANGVPVL